MIEISLHDKIFDLVSEHPAIKEILIDLGFVHLSDQKMLNTVGKIMTIAKASKRHRLTYLQLKEAFEKHGYQLKEDSI